MAKTRSWRFPQALSFLTNTVTKRNGESETLRESEERYRALFDRSLDAVYIHDLKGNFLDANDAALRMLGYTREENPTLSFADLLEGSRLAAALTTLQEIMKNGYQAEMTTFQLRRKDGSIVEVETLGSLITKDGQPFAIQGIARDITDRRRAEAALRTAKEELESRVAERTAELEQKNAELRLEIIERKLAEEELRASEERFRHLYTATPAMLHSIDSEGRIVNVSDLWLEVLGYERSEVIGRKSVEFLTEESRRYAEEVALPDFWKRGGARDIRFQFVRRDGEIVDILLSAIVEQDKEEYPYTTLAVLTDITERKRLEEQLQSAREELEGKVERQMVRKNPYCLTFRELTVLHLVAAGRSNKEIAAELVVSPQTVHKHVANILAKMDVSSRTAAATRALREGLLE